MSRFATFHAGRSLLSQLCGGDGVGEQAFAAFRKSWATATGLYCGNLEYLANLLSTRAFKAAQVRACHGCLAPTDPRGGFDCEIGKVWNFPSSRSA